jgi:hypothetical protein
VELFLFVSFLDLRFFLGKIKTLNRPWTQGNGTHFVTLKILNEIEIIDFGLIGYILDNDPFFMQNNILFIR